MAIDPLTGGFRAPDVLGAPGTVHLEEIDPPPRKQRDPANFSAWMTGPAIVVAGYGGWSRVARPRRKALTEWVGRDSMSVEIPFMIDAFQENDGLFVEAQIRNLERLAGIDEGDPEPPLCTAKSEPPALLTHGHHRAGHVRWFVDTLQWERETIIYNQAGNRVRAGGVVTITQHVEDTRLEIRALTSRPTSSGRTRRRTYKVRAGDTLSKIAARRDVYGDASKWRKIAEANNIRDPKNLKVGRTLKIP